MSDITITVHNTDSMEAARGQCAFDEDADVMVVAIHRYRGVEYVASFDSQDRNHETPLAYVGESITHALQEAGVMTR